MGAPVKKLAHLTGADIGVGLQTALLEIGADEAQGLPVGLDKRDMPCTAAERLNSNGAGSGIEVEHTGSGGAFAKNGKEGFLYSVGCGADGLSSGTQQPSASMKPCDDAHDRILERATRCRLRSERL